MARFIDTPNERTLVNKYVDSYMNGVNQYAKYIDSAPVFVTYYSRDIDKSTENPGLGQVKEIVGMESPLRYNKIKNFPLYGVEEVDPGIVNDGISGVTVDIENTAVILPDTIIPKPDDLFIMNYEENTEKNSSVYRITNVDINAVDSNTYYQISYVRTPYDHNILNKRQVTDEYRFIYGNTGSKYENVLLESKFIEVASLEKQFEKFSNFFLENFYDEKRNMMWYKDSSGKHIYMEEVHEFLNKNKIYIESRTFLKNIYLPEMIPSSNYRRQSSHFYNMIESRKRLSTHNGTGTFQDSFEKIDKTKNKRFMQFRDDFYRAIPLVLYSYSEIDKIKLYYIRNDYKSIPIERYMDKDNYENFVEELIMDDVRNRDNKEFTKFYSYQSKEKLIHSLIELVGKFESENHDIGEILPDKQTSFIESFIYTVCNSLTLEEYYKVNDIYGYDILESLSSRLRYGRFTEKLYILLLAYIDMNDKLIDYSNDKSELKTIKERFNEVVVKYLMKDDFFNSLEDEYYTNQLSSNDMIKLFMYLPCLLYVYKHIMDELLVK